MNCPVCLAPLLVLEHDRIEIDYCHACQGIWLDAGELDLLLGDVKRTAHVLSRGLKLATGEKLRRCPVCRKKMEKVPAEGEPPLIYDRCPRGDGLWFDKGELVALLSRGAPTEGGHEIAQFLRQVFPG